MRIGFIVKCVTQFEAPFYRFIKRNDRQNKLEVFYLEPVSDWRLDRETGLRLYWGIDLFLGYPYDLLDLADFNNAVQKIVNGDFSFVIVNGYKNGLLKLAKALQARNIPVALRLDTTLFNRSLLNILLRKRFLGPVYRLFDHCMVTGTASRDYLEKMGLSPNRISEFPYCTDNSFFYRSITGKRAFPAALKTIKETVILVVAKFIRREDPAEIIHAFGKLDRSDLCLLMAGDGSLMDRLKIAAARYASLKIVFTGYIPYTELPAYYRRSTLFIHAAKNEPWGVSVQEAVSCGCRVICSDKVGAARDLIVGGGNGFIYRSGDIADLCVKITRSLNLPEEKVIESSLAVLAKYNYASVWHGLLSAARQKRYFPIS